MLFKKIDTEGNGLVAFDEMQKMMMGIMGKGSPAMWAQYRKDFDASDHDGNGQLNLVEFEHLLHVVTVKAEADKQKKQTKASVWSTSSSSSAS